MGEPSEPVCFLVSSLYNLSYRWKARYFTVKITTNKGLKKIQFFKNMFCFSDRKFKAEMVLADTHDERESKTALWMVRKLVVSL